MWGSHDSEIGELLGLAAAMVPPELQTEDVLDHLDHEEWELVLEMLGEFDGNTWQTPRYWDLLAEAAVQMDLDQAWFRWRCAESIHGLLRVDLLLAHDADPLPVRGQRPTWDLTGNERRVAAVWIERKPRELEAGARATARLRPLVPTAWSHLAKGDVIGLCEPVIGTATIVERVPPRL